MLWMELCPLKFYTLKPNPQCDSWERGHLGRYLRWNETLRDGPWSKRTGVLIRRERYTTYLSILWNQALNLWDLPLSSVLELIWIIGYPADVTEHACCGGKSPKYLVTRNIRGKVFCVNSNGDIRERNSREEAGCSLERKRKTKFFLFSYKTVLFSG